MIRKITVGLGDRSYPIWIGAGLLGQIADALHEVSFANKIALITNDTIPEQYGQCIVTALVERGYHVSVLRLPDGEEFKTQETLSQIYDFLVNVHIDRYSGLIALGGGVVGDISGFAAASFLRGVPFVQIPTTLLSQVDSSVGGKTGINHPQGKNLIGAFYQPLHVHIDVDVLKTLSDREFSAGLAEVVKYGIIWDADFFKWLEQNKKSLLARDTSALIHAIQMSCQIKANVVENDEKEHGLRALLNLGHTFGHAVETLAGYGVIKHGEAVSIGMVLAARTSLRLGLCSKDDVSRIRNLLHDFNLPVVPPDFSPAEYVSIMQHDKKVKEGVVRVVLNDKIGAARLHEIDALEGLLGELLKEHGE